MTNEHALTRTTQVPNWMVQLAVWAIGVLGTGAVLTLVSVVNWGFWLQGRQGDFKEEYQRELGAVKAHLAADDIKQADLVSMVNSLRTSLIESDRKLDRIEGKLDRVMP